MSKKYKDKTCVYCAVEGVSQTADHVIARAFVPETYRDGLPIVPACLPCHKDKSDLEHYLTALLPFGMCHSAGLEGLLANEKRIKKNNKLRQELLNGMKMSGISCYDGKWDTKMSLPIDDVKLLRLYKYIAQGLMYLEFGIVMPRHLVAVIRINDVKISNFFKNMLRGDSKVYIKKDLGNGVFNYTVAQANDVDEITLWTMSFNVLLESNDPLLGFQPAFIMTYPERMLAKFRILTELQLNVA